MSLDASLWATSTLGPRIENTDPVHAEVVAFLDEEAARLNAGELLEWFDLVEDDVRYQAPVRETVQRGAGSGFATGMFHFDETYETLELKVRRLAENVNAWAEVPASRTRRFVTGVRVFATDTEREYRVSSSILLVRNRYDYANWELMSGERIDVLRRTDDGLRLARRTLLVDQATLGMPNFAIFF